ncbi:putative tol protein [Diplodia seriata]|uniref:Putative tol protein n=1 Tax=Diplodia seriata TaxID=420778 RepID=A0A0G2EDN7_9PEZI|nr:putative tol protein [Diplodia seriata]
MHAALSETAALPLDLYEKALSWYFDSEEFKCWVKKDRTWHLRCTTLAALAFNYLRDRFESVPDVAVVSVGPGSDFFEPYSHLELDLSMSLDLAVEFASWSLEAEHGDLGLDTDNDNKPPHSALGRTLVHRGGARAIQSLVNSIANDAFNNLTFIKLRLDAIRTATSIDAVLSVGDRLPANRVAMFDAAIERIAAQAQPQSRLGLAAISAAANRYNGRPFGELERELHRVVPRSGGAQGPRGRYSVAEVLKATAGFLTVDNTEDQVVAPYHESFFLYVTEGYNELLVWTRGDLRKTKLARQGTSIF